MHTELISVGLLEDRFNNRGDHCFCCKFQVSIVAPGQPEPDNNGGCWRQPVADLRVLCAIRHDPVRRRALFSSCTFLAYHGVLKHFIQGVRCSQMPLATDFLVDAFVSRR